MIASEIKILRSSSIGQKYRVRLFRIQCIERYLNMKYLALTEMNNLTKIIAHGTSPIRIT